MIKPCAHCGKLTKNFKYCSTRCKLDAQYEREKRRPAKEPRISADQGSPKQARICTWPGCGKPLPAGSSKYCREHRMAAERKRKREDNARRREAQRAIPRKRPPVPAVEIPASWSWPSDPWDTLIVPGAGDGISPEACPLDCHAACNAGGVG